MKINIALQLILVLAVANTALAMKTMAQLRAEVKGAESKNKQTNSENELNAQNDRLAILSEKFLDETITTGEKEELMSSIQEYGMATLITLKKICREKQITSEQKIQYKKAVIDHIIIKVEYEISRKAFLNINRDNNSHKLSEPEFQSSDKQ